MSTGYASLYRGERRDRMNKQPIERETVTVWSSDETEIATNPHEDMTMNVESLTDCKEMNMQDKWVVPVCSVLTILAVLCYVAPGADDSMSRDPKVHG
jgi:hypothetical protein